MKFEFLLFILLTKFNEFSFIFNNFRQSYLKLCECENMLKRRGCQVGISGGNVRGPIKVSERKGALTLSGKVRQGALPDSVAERSTPLSFRKF